MVGLKAPRPRAGVRTGVPCIRRAFRIHGRVAPPVRAANMLPNYPPVRLCAEVGGGGGGGGVGESVTGDHQSISESANQRINEPVNRPSLGITPSHHRREKGNTTTEKNQPLNEPTPKLQLTPLARSPFSILHWPGIARSARRPDPSGE